jgi:acyl carrier protein
MFARIRETCPPIRGVFHAAGVLKDAPAASVTPGDVRSVAAVKVAGAAHLDHATGGDALDAFVLFSSVASVFGTPGQASYAAGNAYLDALAHARHRRGLAATSINFGPVRDVGLAAASSVRGISLARFGFDGIDSGRVVEAIDALLAAGTTQAVCAAFDVAQWQTAMGTLGDTTFASELADATSREAGREREVPLAEQLRAAPAGHPRRALMELILRTEVGEVLRIPAARVAADRPLRSLGLDSLMALELRNRLERRASVALTPSLALNHPTVAAIAAHVAERMGIDLDAARAETVVTDDEAPDALKSFLEELEHLSDEEARDLLAREK